MSGLKASAKLSSPAGKAKLPDPLKTEAKIGASAIAVVNSDDSLHVDLNTLTTKIYTITDSKIRKSDGTVLKSLPATQDYNVPDSIITDGDGTLHIVKATDPFTAKNLLELIETASGAILYNDLTTALKLGAVIQLLSTADLTTNLTSEQVLNFIEALNASTIYADLTALQDAGLIPLFSPAQIDTNITTAQVTGLGAANIQKLIQSQINSLVHTQLLMLNNAQLIDVLDNVMAQQFINDNLTQAIRNKLNAIYVLKTGQTTSYATGDDGDRQRGRLGWGALPLNNIFGNTHRFTDYLGNVASTSNYVIDHGTGLGWNTVIRQGVGGFQLSDYEGIVSGINTGAGITVNGITYKDWFLPTCNEYDSIIMKGGTDGLNYAPFNMVSSSFNNSFTSSTQRSSVANYQADGGGSRTVRTINSVGNPIMIARVHF